MRILITGENGYISKELYKSLKTKYNSYDIILKSVRGESLDRLDLTQVDVVIHTAAIVHKKESTQSEKIYFEVNTKLTSKLAQKAKKSGVKQFIFFSTMAVFGNDVEEINMYTALRPTSLYGKSKLAAEQLLNKLENDTFKVAIVRPPMVYGPRCPGNYKALSKLCKVTPIFPVISNNRSMIFISNLTEFISQLIESKDAGVFHPQDKYLVNTSEMVRQIALLNKKKIFYSSILGKLVKLGIGKKEIYKKVFGNLYYATTLSNYKDNSYQKYDFQESILFSEKE